jgi:hypothetical protein
MADRDVEGLLRWSLACMALASAVIHASAASTIPSTTPVRDSATTRATTPTRQVD